jgi:hypothetical protein
MFIHIVQIEHGSDHFSHKLLITQDIYWYPNRDLDK